MKKMTKILALLLAMVLLISAAGCAKQGNDVTTDGGQGTTAKPNPDPTATPTSTTLPTTEAPTNGTQEPTQPSSTTQPTTKPVEPTTPTEPGKFYMYGVWKFNDILTYLGEEPEDAYIAYAEVNFTSAGEEFSVIQWDAINFGEIVTFLGYCSPANSGLPGAHPYEQEVWKDKKYQTVDFGIEPQEVTEEFYNWMLANAVKQ